MERCSLKEAIELARNLGVHADDFEAITQALLRESAVEHDTISILKDAAYETISNVMVERMMHLTREPITQEPKQIAAPSEPVIEMPVVEVPVVVADSFDAQFASRLADMASLGDLARTFEANNETENAVQTLQAMSALHDTLNADLQKNSKNRWFLSGNTLAQKLRLMGTQTVDSDAGPCIPHAIKANTPLHHLISHHQLFLSCGFNSLANAYALERQVQEGLPITMERTRQYAEQCFAATIASSASFKSLVFDDGIHMADAQELERTADDVRDKHKMPFHVIYLCSEELASFEDVTTKVPIIDLIKTDLVVHFVINIARSHWLLTSVVKLPNSSYALYHLNSFNDPIDVGQLGGVMAYIDGLVWVAANK